MNRIDHFKTWLTNQFSLASGSRLPTGKELARCWNMSESTIVKVLRQYQESGKITRIRCKGTFVGGPEKLHDNAPHIKSSSAERIVEAICESIYNGNIPVGAILPSVKFLALKYHIGPGTVIKTYNILRNRKLVQKIGKSFYVGGLSSGNVQRMHQKIIIVLPDETAQSTIFCEKTYGALYRAFEQELSLLGFGLEFVLWNDFKKLYKTIATAHTLPAAILFWKCSFEQAHEALALALFIERKFKSSAIQFIIDAVCQVPLPVTKGIIELNRWRMSMFYARTLRRYIELRGWMSAVVWRHGKQDESLAAELHAIPCNEIPGFSAHDAVIPQSAKASVVFDKIYTQQSARLWIFTSDSLAAAALSWAQTQKISVPGTLKIIGYSNDPAFTHLRITTLDPNISHLGFLLAHHIIGDITIDKTKRGFINYGGRMIVRETT